MDVIIKVVSSRVQVYATYNETFILEAHRLEGRYKKRSKMWSFHRSKYAEVAKVCNKIFGTRFRIKRENAIIQ